MRVSQFEIYRLVQRSLEGLGAGYGVDRDGAKAVAWLEARGLPGLEIFARDLDGLERDWVPPEFRSSGTSRLLIDAGGRSAIAFAGAAIDLLKGLAAAGDLPAAMILERCGSPLFLLPFVAAEASHELGFAMTWQSPAGGAAIRIPGDGRLGLYLPPNVAMASILGNEAPVDIEILAVAAGATPLPVANGLVQAADEDELARRLELSLDRGVDVDGALWARIDKVAARVQVPASAVSRIKGAGGGDANA
jgi:hypothetical protein